jgi:aspartyl-tRNA(Asn)/glutamyl-tRNA(Gln) amidotransferase subunit A
MQASIQTLTQLADDLATGRITSRALIERCLDRIRMTDGEGARVFLRIRAEQALAMADRVDRARGAGSDVARFAGIPISIKDLFDIAGEVTTAGSMLLRDAPAATRDAVSVARLVAAGFVPIGRTNMTEFAFSGLGLNCHYGTPANPFDRATKRIPGGSSSGAAVSITDGMSFGALGTDTGGSCRIPAAMCGIVGFKPTARRVPLTGALPLAPSLDSVGPLAASVECCAILDSILAGESEQTPRCIALKGLHFAVPQSLVFEDIDPEVATAFEHALRTIAASGAKVSQIVLPELLELPQLNRKGGLAPPEALVLHRDWIAKNPDAYDPRVRARILRGNEQDAADYIQLLHARSRWIETVTASLEGFDAIAMPTVPIIAPSIESLADDAAYGRANMLALRNPSIVNFLDGCAISLPCHRAGDAPVGLMLAALHGADRRLLAIAASVEQALKSG